MTLQEIDAKIDFITRRLAELDRARLRGESEGTLEFGVLDLELIRLRIRKSEIARLRSRPHPVYRISTVLG